jgi:hypothetical protein
LERRPTQNPLTVVLEVVARSLSKALLLQKALFVVLEVVAVCGVGKAEESLLWSLAVLFLAAPSAL